MAKRKFVKRVGLSDKQLQELLSRFGVMLFQYLISHASPGVADRKSVVRYIKKAMQHWLRAEQAEFKQFDMLDFSLNRKLDLNKYRIDPGLTEMEFKKFMSQRAEQRRTERFNIPGGILGTGTGGAG